MIPSKEDENSARGIKTRRKGQHICIVCFSISILELRELEGTFEFYWESIWEAGA